MQPRANGISVMYKPISLKDVRVHCLTCDKPAQAAGTCDDPLSLDIDIAVSCHGALSWHAIPRVVLAAGAVVMAFAPSATGAVA